MSKLSVFGVCKIVVMLGSFIYEPLPLLLPSTLITPFITYYCWTFSQFSLFLFYHKLFSSIFYLQLLFSFKSVTNVEWAVSHCLKMPFSFQRAPKTLRKKSAALSSLGNFFPRSKEKMSMNIKVTMLQSAERVKEGKRWAALSIMMPSMVFGSPSLELRG